MTDKKKVAQRPTTAAHKQVLRDLAKAVDVNAKLVKAHAEMKQTAAEARMTRNKALEQLARERQMKADLVDKVEQIRKIVG